MGDNYIAITSPSTRNLDLLEDSENTLFLDVSLQDLNIPSATSKYTKGAITKVYTFLNLFTPSIHVDTDYITGRNTTSPSMECNITKN